MDINLRNPWWNDSLLHNISQKLKWLKINDEELPILCEALKFFNEDEKERIEFLLENLGLELLILTKGSKGALLIDKNKIIVELPIKAVEKLADTVGAGDAFASVVILGLYKNWENHLIIKRAIEFASKVCGINGAIVEDNNFYKETLKEWEYLDKDKNK